MKPRDRYDTYDHNHTCWECAHFRYDVSCNRHRNEQVDNRPYDHVPNDNSRCEARDVKTQRFQWACEQFEQNK